MCWARVDLLALHGPSDEEGSLLARFGFLPAFEVLRSQESAFGNSYLFARKRYH